MLNGWKIGKTGCKREIISVVCYFHPMTYCQLIFLAQSRYLFHAEPHSRRELSIRRLLTDYRLPLTAYCLLLTAYCLLLTAFRLPLTAYRLPLTAYCLLLTY